LKVMARKMQAQTPVVNCENSQRNLADVGGKAALARTHSKTCRFFGGVGAREAFWSAERQFRFGPETGFAAIRILCPTEGSWRRGVNTIKALMAASGFPLLTLPFWRVLV